MELAVIAMKSSDKSTRSTMTGGLVSAPAEIVDLSVLMIVPVLISVRIER